MEKMMIKLTPEQKNNAKVNKLNDVLSKTGMSYATFSKYNKLVFDSTKGIWVIVPKNDVGRPKRFSP